MVIIILVIGIILFEAAVSHSRIILFDYSHHAFRLVASCFSISRIIKTTKKPHILRFCHGWHRRICGSYLYCTSFCECFPFTYSLSISFRFGYKFRW